LVLLTLATGRPPLKHHEEGSSGFHEGDTSPVKNSRIGGEKLNRVDSELSRVLGGGLGCPPENPIGLAEGNVVSLEDS